MTPSPRQLTQADIIVNCDAWWPQLHVPFDLSTPVQSCLVGTSLTSTESYLQVQPTSFHIQFLSSFSFAESFRYNKKNLVPSKSF